MNMDKKSIVAIFLCIVLFTGYMAYLQKKYPEYYAGQQTTKVESESRPEQAPAAGVTPPATPEAAAPAPVDPEAPAEVLALSASDLVFETATRTLRFDQNTSAISSIQLKEYSQDLDNKLPVEILDSPLVVQGTPQIADRLGRQGFTAVREGNSIRFTRKNGPWEITQAFMVPDQGYGIDVTVTFKNTSDQPQELTGGVLIQENVAVPQGSTSIFNPMAYAGRDHSFVHSINAKYTSKLIADYCKDGEGAAFSLNNEKVDFIGIDKHYFLSLWSKDQPLSYTLDRAAQASSFYCPITLTAYQRFGLVEPGVSTEIQLAGYFGPKQSAALEAQQSSLTTALKLGWFSFFARPLLKGLQVIHTYVSNWGIAIILITLLLKMLFYPLTKSAAVSMKKMQKLQPEMNKLREKFKDDPQRQQRELMAFMSQNKVNPFKGCLPILPQIPVFIAFYNVLSQSIELRHAPFYGWLQDLAARDPYYVTPLLLGVLMFIQQKLTPNPGMDKNQERIMLMMPIIFTFMMLSLPAGMVLYMMTNTIVSILQQQWLNRKLAKQFG
jgi:YidC/Oxa1 family membrane protein insertase